MLFDRDFVLSYDCPLLLLPEHEIRIVPGDWEIRVDNYPRVVV